MRSAVMQHAVPGQLRVRVVPQHPRDEAGAARQPGAARHVPVARDLPGRNGTDGGKDLVGGRQFGHEGLA